AAHRVGHRPVAGLAECGDIGGVHQFSLPGRRRKFLVTRLGTKRGPAPSVRALIDARLGVSQLAIRFALSIQSAISRVPGTASTTLADRLASVIASWSDSALRRRSCLRLVTPATSRRAA